LEVHLRVKVVLHYGENQMCQALALLDTGAEVNLVRKGLVPSDTFQNSDSPCEFSPQVVTNWMEETRK
jgi:hypothetical protein